MIGAHTGAAAHVETVTGRRLMALMLDAKLPRVVRTDAKRLQQILKNLLSNAFKFTEKGHVTLELTARVPLRAPRQASFSGSLEIADASGALPNKKARIDGLDGG